MLVGRRRKVKCQLISEDVTACSECLKNGVHCSVSEPVSHPASDQVTDPAAQQGLEQRLERIEALLSILVRTRERSERELRQPQPQMATPAGPNPDITSILSLLLDNNNDSGSQITQLPIYQPISATAPSSVKQSLLSLLPSAEDAATIIDNTLAWVLELPDPPGLAVIQSGVGTHEILVASQQCSAIVIAKNLLYFALYIQQLPADFDPGRLQMADFESRVPQYVEAVSSSVLADDEILCTEEGFDCLLLLAAIHFNDARFQSAWLTFRRALDVARVLGFNDAASRNIPSNDQGRSTYLQRKWLAAAIGENYCGVLLGLEPTSTLESFKLEESDPASSGSDVDLDVEFFRQILPIASLYIKRNDFQLYQGPAPTEALDKALDELESSMPESWWRTPKPVRERSIASAQQHHRFVCQMWVYQLRIMIHLPYLVRPQISEECGHSRQRAVEAARIMLHRFLLHRQPGQIHIHCRVVELGAFLASVAILLTVADHDAMDEPTRGAFRRNNPDILLVEQVINSLESLGRASRRELFCKQSAEVLSALLAETSSPGNGLGHSIAARLSDTIRKGKESTVSETVPTSTTSQSLCDNHPHRTELYDLLACSFPEPLGTAGNDPSAQTIAGPLPPAVSPATVVGNQATNMGEALEGREAETAWDYGVIDWDA